MLIAAVAVFVAAVALYVALLPEAPRDSTGRPMTESEQVRLHARDLLRANRPNEAVETLRHFLSDNPADVSVRLFLAELYLHLGELDRCEAALNEAMRFSPGDAGVLWLRGVLADRRGQNPEPLYRQAAESPSATPDVWGMYGLYLLNEDQPERAEAYLRRAVEGGTNNGLVHGALGQIAFGRNQIEEARRLLTRATELAPQSADAWALLAEVQKNCGQTESAVASLRRALEVASGPQRAAVLMELGKVHMAQSRWTEAAEWFAQAGEYPAWAPRASLLAAQCFYFADAYARAMHHIDRAAAAAPNDPRVRQWKEKIEIARFGPPTASRKPLRSLLDVPPAPQTETPAPSRKEKSAQP